MNKRSLKFVTLGFAVLLVVGAGAVGGLILQPLAPPQERRIKMTARQYAYDPAVLRINKGDTVRLRITSLDVIHGLYLEAFDLNIKIIPDSPYLEVSHPLEVAGDDQPNRSNPHHRKERPHKRQPERWQHELKPVARSADTTAQRYPFTQCGVIHGQPGLVRSNSF